MEEEPRGDIGVGDRVLFVLSDQRELGTVRFRGRTHFSEGEWYGVELDHASGNTDGVVTGVWYFRCSAETGVFCKRDMLQPVLIHCMSEGARSMMQHDGSAEDDIHVPGEETLDGAWMELLERLWGSLNPQNDVVISHDGFKRFMLMMADQEQEEDIRALYISACDALPNGLDFPAFVELCGPENLDLDRQCLEEALEVLATQAKSAEFTVREIEMKALKVENATLKAVLAERSTRNAQLEQKLKEAEAHIADLENNIAAFRLTSCPAHAEEKDINEALQAMKSSKVVGSTMEVWEVPKLEKQEMVGSAAASNSPTINHDEVRRALGKLGATRTEIASTLRSHDPEGKGVVNRRQLESLLTQHDTSTDVSHLDEFSDKGEIRYLDYLSGVLGFDTSELAGECHGCRIAKTEERGITIKQLQALGQYIKNHTQAEAWVSTNEKAPRIRLQPDTVSLYDLVSWLIKPATRPQRCAYVELVASGRQPPTWFVSHWWGEPVLLFVACLAQHSTDRGLGADSPYWVCAYANNQWDLQGEIAKDPAETSFRKAMKLAVGTVSVIDAKAQCLTRVWCAYEIYVSLVEGKEDGDGEDYKYDIYTASGDGTDAVGFTDGLAAVDRQKGKEEDMRFRGGAHGSKAQRESKFPPELAQNALHIKIQDAAASEESDRRHILNSIAGRGLEELEVEALTEHPKYELVNSALRWRLAVAMYESASSKGKLQEWKLDEIREPEGWQHKALALYRGMAKAWTDRAQYDLALDFQQRMLNIQDLSLATTHFDMANTFHDKGKYQHALQHHNTALRIRLDKLDANHLEVADSYSSKASVFWRQGKYHQALDLYDKALAIQSQTLGMEARIAQTYSNKGIVFEQMRRYDKAQEFFDKALDIRLKALGAEHPDVAESYKNKADAFRRQEDYGQALQFLDKALRLREKAYGPKHPEVADGYHIKALIRSKQGCHNEALELFNKTLGIVEEALGMEHPDVAAVYSNKAKTLKVLGNHEEGDKLEGRAMNIWSKETWTQKYNEVGNDIRYGLEACIRDGLGDRFGPGGRDVFDRLEDGIEHFVHG